MADEPSDAWSCTDGDGARACRNKKRKISQACSYPNKKDGFVIRNGKELFVIGALAAIVFMVVYLFTEGELEEEEGEEEEEQEDEDEDDVEEEDEGDNEGFEEEEEEEDDEDDDADADADDDARADLLEVAVDCFIATKAWAECELGPENAILQEILGMLRLIPGYEEAVKAKQDAVKANRCLEF